MMALRKGGIHHGGAEKGNTERGGWGTKCKKKLFGVKCSSKGGTNRIFTNVSHFKEVLMI